MNEATRQLILWNRVWMALFVALALLWAFNREVSRYSEDASRVRGSWEGKTLRFFSLHGGVVISYLESRSADGSVAARLPTPLFILDSGPAHVDPNTWRTLEWRDDAGSVRPGPPVGAPVSGLYARLESSR
jgi:hypothetical protein